MSARSPEYTPMCNRHLRFYALTMRPDTDGEPQLVIQKVIHTPENRMTGSVIIGRVMSLNRSLA